MSPKNSKPSYISKGIQEDIPEEVILYLWYLVDQRRGTLKSQMDYLQVFKLSPMELEGKSVLKVVFYQEMPPVEETYIFKNTGFSIAEKIFVIEQPDNTTMLKASEY